MYLHMIQIKRKFKDRYRGEETWKRKRQYVHRDREKTDVAPR
jgi:hypothetical protein